MAETVTTQGTEPTMLYPQEVEALLNGLQRISQLFNDKSRDRDKRKIAINSELGTWIRRLQTILRTRK